MSPESFSRAIKWSRIFKSRYQKTAPFTSYIGAARFASKMYIFLCYRWHGSEYFFGRREEARSRGVTTKSGEFYLAVKKGSDRQCKWYTVIARNHDPLRPNISTSFPVMWQCWGGVYDAGPTLLHHWLKCRAVFWFPRLSSPFLLLCSQETLDKLWHDALPNYSNKN